MLAEIVGSFVTSEFIINLDARFMFVLTSHLSEHEMVNCIRKLNL